MMLSIWKILQDHLIQVLIQTLTKLQPASTKIVPHTTDHNRIDDNNSPIDHVAHSTNISAIQNGSNTQPSIVTSSVDDVSSTIDSITNGSTLKKRNLPTNDTSGSQNIAARVKERRRPIKKKQKTTTTSSYRS